MSSSIEIRGLPQAVTFSTGQAIGRGSWKVPISELSNLRMILQSSSPVSSRLDLTLVTASYIVLAVARSELIIEAVASSATTSSDNRAQISGSAPPLPSAAKQEDVAQHIAGDARITPVPRSAGREEDQPRELGTGSQEAGSSTLPAAVWEPATPASRDDNDAIKPEDPQPKQPHPIDVTSDRTETPIPIAAEGQTVARSESSDETRATSTAVIVDRTVQQPEARAEDSRRQQGSSNEPSAVITATANLAVLKEAPKKAESNDPHASMAEEEREQAAASTSGPAQSPLQPDTFAKRAAATPPSTPSVQLALSERLMVQGERYLTHGNIVVAREYFLRAAEMGIAGAAFKLAETHDPHELGRLNVRGLSPDLVQARRWYERASQLGATDADARLHRLSKASQLPADAKAA